MQLLGYPATAHCTVISHISCLYNTIGLSFSRVWRRQYCT